MLENVQEYYPRDGYNGKTVSIQVVSHLWGIISILSEWDLLFGAAYESRNDVDIKPKCTS